MRVRCGIYDDPIVFSVCRLYRGDDLAFVIRLYDGRLGAERTDALRDIVNEVGMCGVRIFPARVCRAY